MAANDPVRDVSETIIAQLRHDLEDGLRRLVSDHVAAAEQAREEVGRVSGELETARLEINRLNTSSGAAALDDGSATQALARLLDAVRALDRAGSISSILRTLADAAAAEAGRVAVCVLQGVDVRVWHSHGIVPEASGSDEHVLALETAGIVRQAIERQEACGVRGEESGTDPSFAALPPGHDALAVPVRIAGSVVAVIYADDVVDAGRGVPAAWRVAIELLALYAGRALEAVTAFRTSQLRQAGRDAAPATPSGATPVAGADDQHESARRYARLLVSEIKLYHESAVRTGREQHDLLERLAPEIDRARRLFEARVPADIRSKSDYLEEELLRTLAEGNRARLGSGA